MPNRDTESTGEAVNPDCAHVLHACERLERMLTQLLHAHGLTPDAESERISLKTTDLLPRAMSPADLMRALNMCQSTLYKYQREGKLKRFLLPRAIGVKRYSGRLVEAYLDGGSR